MSYSTYDPKGVNIDAVNRNVITVKFIEKIIAQNSSNSKIYIHQA